MDLSAIQEEIALEGLDGITLNTLWLRLEKRPGFQIESYDDFIKQSIWKCICQAGEVEFFLLETPRLELDYRDLEDYVYENRCHIPADFPTDLYSFTTVDMNGIVGCCDTFLTRVAISNAIRSEDGMPLITVQDAAENWGQRLTIVASQKLRFKALLHADYLPSGISAESYCIIERIGRSRYVGEPSKIQGRMGLSNESMSSSRLFVFLKILTRNGYITRQHFNIHNSHTAKFYQTRLVHLRHFYRKSNANIGSLLNSVCRYLKYSPNFVAPIDTLVEQCGLKLKDIHKRLNFNLVPFKVELVPYRTIYANATRAEYIQRNGREKKLKVLRLVAPFRLEEENDEDDKDEAEEEGYESDEDLGSGKGAGAGTLSGQYLYDVSMPSTILHMIEASGTQGTTESQLCRTLHTTSKVIEHSIKALMNNGVIARFTRAQKTVRINVFMTHEAGAQYKIEMEKEKSQLLDVQDEDTTQNIEETEELLSDLQSVEEIVKRLNLSWVIEKMDTPKKAEIVISQKRIDRRDLILKILHEKQVVSDHLVLFKAITRWEKSCGIKELMCRKSFKRMIIGLFEEGNLNYVKLTSGVTSSMSEQKIFQFLCVPELEEDDMVLKKAAINHHMYSIRYMKVKKLEEKAHFLNPSKAYETLKPPTTRPSVKPKRIKRIVKGQQKSAYCKGKYGKYGKMEKAQLFHEFMFYLLYDYKGDPDAAQTQSQATNEEEKPPPVYLDVDDWRRYVPPLKIHDVAMVTKMIPGSCMIGDLLMSMPVCIFAKLIFITFEVKDLKEILTDHDKRLYPLSCLPSMVRTELLQPRNYLFKLNDTARLLCSLGILSYGPKVTCPMLEYVILFMHKKAMLLDTTSSVPGYCMTMCPEGGQFPEMHFEFDNLDTVKTFWNKVCLICLSSNLNYKLIKDVPGNKGNVNILEAVKPRPLGSIDGTNWLPGDRRGAGGFDSSLYMHLARCWSSKMVRTSTSVFNAVRRKPAVPVPVIGEPAEPVAVIGKPAVPVAVIAKARRQVVKRKVIVRAQKKIAVRRAEAPKGAEKVPKVPKKRIRRKRLQSAGKEVPPRKIPKRKTVHDDDTQARRHMERLRSRFKPLENGVILLSHVACCLLYPYRPPTDIPFRAVRSVIKEILPTVFKDKTLSSLRQRSIRLARDSTFLQHITVYLAKARYDQGLMQKYKSVKGKVSDPDVVPIYVELIKDLLKKFRTPAKGYELIWPSSLTDLHHNYDLIKVADTLKSKTRINVLDCHVDTDILSSLLRDLLLGWMYNPSQVSNAEMYYNFCKIPNSVIFHTCDSLKEAGVITRSRRPYDIGHGSGHIHNLILSQRHKEFMKSSIPLDIFEKTLKQIQVLEDAFQRRNSAPFTSPGNQNKDVQPGADDQSCDQGQGHLPKDGKDGKAELAYEEMSWKQYQGGCSMALITLFAADMVHFKLDFPDEMIQLSERGRKQLTLKEPGMKRKLDDMEETANDSNEDEWRPMLKGIRKNIMLKGKFNKYQNKLSETASYPSTSSYITEEEGSSNARLEIKKGNSTINLKCYRGASDMLKNFAVFLASGTLLTLARTSVIDNLDITKSSYNKNGTFSVAPLKMEFALKTSGDVGRHPENRKEKRKVIDGELCSESCEEMEVDNEKLDDGMEVRAEAINVPANSSGDETIASELPGKSEKSQTPLTSCFTRFHRSHSKLINLLVHHFPLGFHKTDVLGEIRSTLPSKVMAKGLSIYESIDKAGFSGISEPELEQSMGLPFSSLTPVIKMLCEMNAILKVGIIELRYVSRPHLEHWTLESYTRGHSPDADKSSNDPPDGSTCNRFRFQCRPWLTLYGELNHVFLHTALHSMLVYLFHQPGISVEDVVTRFNPHLQAPSVRALLDILLEIQCIEISHIPLSAKATVFGSTAFNESGWLHSTIRAIDVSIFCPIHIGYFIDYITRYCQEQKAKRAVHVIDAATENVGDMDATENVDDMDATENVDNMDATENVDDMDATENVDDTD